MKLIEIQRHYFRIKGDKRSYFCTKADTDSNLNVKVVYYEDDQNIGGGNERVIRGEKINDIIPEKPSLGMAYMPASDVTRLNTQTPDSMGYDVHDALNKLKEAVGGNVTDYVCERLKWSREEIENRLFAEQVDAVALAIYNHEARNQAMIIGDQTGIGKGRVASSMIRYAIVKGLIPVYCTENAGLFSDNYRDLVDIGCKDLKPFIINNSTSGQTDARIKTLNDNDEFVVVHEPLKDKKQRAKIFASGKMPSGYDYILTTYSQLKNAFKQEGGEENEGDDYYKYEFLLKIAPKAFFIYDESHNVSGSKAIVTKWWEPENVELGGSNQFYCFNELARQANGIVFLSATFAKRPENLVVYANRTCISESGLKDTELIQAIQDGGEALQEVISSDIVREGQMIRRESVYDGIQVNYIYLDKDGAAKFGTPDLEKQHRSICDYITNIINEINEFEKEFVIPYVQGLSNISNLVNVEIDKTSKKLGISRDPIFSKLFMIVNQMLFSIKADAVANHAIRRLQEGKKVVIGLSSTMESFLDSFESEFDGEINCDFTSVLEKAVKSTLKIRSKDNEGGVSEMRYIDPKELGFDGESKYYELLEKIKKASSGISISPIDYITQKIEAAGYVVSEVTGRKKKIIFTNEKGTKGNIVTRKYVTRNVAFGQFQNNKSDVLIINASGATGASAHATTKNTNLKPEEVKPRVMIIAQMELDVNKEVQKRGRINRTGQIKELPPSYDYLISAIPAEKRLMMMMQKKLKSLDANSTSNQKQSTSVIDTSDFMNKYGDKICTEYLIENEDINLKLNDPIGLESEKRDDKKDVSIAKITGHVPILTCAEQDDFYSSIQARYDKYVHSLMEKGEYDLEVEAMDLDAKQVGDLRLLIGASNGESKFADAVYVGTYDCKILRKPYSSDEIRTMISNYMEGDYNTEKAKEKARSFAVDMKEYYDETNKEIEKNLTERRDVKISETKERFKIKGATESDIESSIAIINEDFDKKIRKQTAKNSAEKLKSQMLEFFYCGRSCILDSANTRAICLGTEIGTKTKNLYSPSNVTISFAVANSTKLLELDIQEEDYKELTTIMTYTRGMWNNSDERTLNTWNDIIKEATADREIREIIVGNTLRSYKNKPEGAKLISFTTHDGEILKGLLVPKKSASSQGQENKMVLSRVSLKKFYPILKSILDSGDSSSFDLTRGTALLLNNNNYYATSPILFDVRNQQTYNALVKNRNDDFEKIAGGRTFQMYGSGSSKHYVVNVEKNNFDSLIKLLDEMQFNVELLPSQIAMYFKDESNKLKKGNWKKVTTSINNIPKSSSVNDIERKKKLLILAQAKIKIAKAKANLKDIK